MFRDTIAPKSTEAGFIHAPFVGTSRALVVKGLGLIPIGRTVRAGTAGMEPIAVGIEMILNDILIETYIKRFGICFCLFPGCGLHGNEFNISLIFAMVKECMRELVEEKVGGVRLIGVIKDRS